MPASETPVTRENTISVPGLPARYPKLVYTTASGRGVFDQHQYKYST